MSVTLMHGAYAPLSAVVASNIRAEAARRGWRQLDLARALGVTPTTISRKWLGVRLWQLDELEDVAEALGVSVPDLLRRYTARDSNPEPADMRHGVVRRPALALVA